MARARGRKLTAILSADAVGFSRQMHRDEAGTHARLQSCREIIDRLVAEHDGRIVGSARRQQGPRGRSLEDVLRGRTSARGKIGGAREAPGPTHARARVHQDEADLAAGGAAPPHPGFIPGGSDGRRWATHA